ncbi:hypothetical protein Trydic_g5505 [Trypoxylus dichotomus]
MTTSRQQRFVQPQSARNERVSLDHNVQIAEVRSATLPQSGFGEHSNGQRYFCDLGIRYNLPLHEEQEGEKEPAVQPKEHTIVERSSRHTVQLNHEAESSKEATLEDFAFNSTAQMKTSSVILRTANVDISNKEGKKFKARALLDSGYQNNFITKELCDAIGCSIQEESIPFKEEVTPKSILTKEERACEVHFVTHHKQEADGRFVVRLDTRGQESASRTDKFI